MRLLVVEDNEQLSRLIAEGLEAAGFDVDVRHTGAETRTAVAAVRYGAVLLDLGLPDEDGLTVLREMRRRRDQVPVIALTARDGIKDRVRGLRTGADDYLVKPFAFEELVARVEAVLRRPGEFLGTSLIAGNLELDVAAHQLFIGGKPQAMSGREIAVLELLMRRKGRVVPKKNVEEHIFGAADIASNAVEVYVHRVRKHLCEHRASATIHTIRGVGYLLTEDKAS